jgi:hypothetical protein
VTEFSGVWAYNPKEWLEIKKVRPIGFIKQNQGFEISRLLDQQREQEQHPGIDR